MTQHVFNKFSKRKKIRSGKIRKSIKIWKLFSPRVFEIFSANSLIRWAETQVGKALIRLLVWQAVEIYLLFFNGILNVRKPKKRLKSRISFGSVNKLISPSMPLENTPQMEIRYHNCGLLYNRRQLAYLIPLKFFLYGSDIKHEKFLFAFLFSSCFRFLFQLGTRFIKLMLTHIPFYYCGEQALRPNVFVVETCFCAVWLMQLTLEGEICWDFLGRLEALGVYKIFSELNFSKSEFNKTDWKMRKKYYTVKLLN